MLERFLMLIRIGRKFSALRKIEYKCSDVFDVARILSLQTLHKSLFRPETL